MTISREDGGRLNAFAKEPQMYVDPIAQQQMKDGNYQTHSEKAERLNGLFAMIGVIAALGAYAVSGQIIPGIW
jgi:hypothetical protein